MRRLIRGRWPKRRREGAQTRTRAQEWVADPKPDADDPETRISFEFADGTTHEVDPGSSIGRELLNAAELLRRHA